MILPGRLPELNFPPAKQVLDFYYPAGQRLP
jgi:hypothetical protein